MDYLLGDDKFEKFIMVVTMVYLMILSTRSLSVWHFPEIWERLRQENIVSSLESVKFSLFANSPFKSLSPEQEKAKIALFNNSRDLSQWLG